MLAMKSAFRGLSNDMSVARQLPKEWAYICLYHIDSIYMSYIWSWTPVYIHIRRALPIQVIHQALFSHTYIQHHRRLNKSMQLECSFGAVFRAEANPADPPL